MCIYPHGSHTFYDCICNFYFLGQVTHYRLSLDNDGYDFTVNSEHLSAKRDKGDAILAKHIKKGISTLVHQQQSKMLQL